jgi:DNA-binding response OmpR family regulator
VRSADVDRQSHASAIDHDADSIAIAFEHGVTDFITKPINPMILLHHTRYMLRAKNVLEALIKSEARKHSFENSKRKAAMKRRGIYSASRSMQRNSNDSSGAMPISVE